jgi:hypothetical protein
MTVDYPAAHSMDTCWFAVDRDGHVAYFGSAEAGAVPEEAFIEGPYEVLRELGQVLPTTEVLYNFVGHRPPGPLGARGKHWSVAMRGSGAALLFLTSPDVVRDEVAAGQAVQVPSAGAGAAFILTDPPPQLVARIHDAGACAGCFYYYQRGAGDELPWPAEHGLFRYSHLCENWISGPYGLKEVPGRPIHVDQLPPRLREAVAACRFPSLCFAQTPHIQPVEHGVGNSWEPAYLTGDGLRIRPNLRNEFETEESYAARYRDLTGPDHVWLAGIDFLPPPPEERDE